MTAPTNSTHLKRKPVSIRGTQEGVHPIPEPAIHVYSKRINHCPDKHTGKEERVE